MQYVIFKLTSQGGERNNGAWSQNSLIYKYDYITFNILKGINQAVVSFLANKLINWPGNFEKREQPMKLFTKKEANYNF